MSTEKTTLNWGTIIKIAGALVAFIIGSGFATGQELLQYFTSFGVQGIMGCVVAMLGYVYLSVSFLKPGKEKNFTNISQVFSYYCGPKIGRVFEIVAFSYMICGFITFLSGAGATMAQYYGLPSIVGNIIIATLSILTALMGLKKVVNIIGSIGPVIIVTTIATACVFLLLNIDGLSAGLATATAIDIPQPSSSWLWSGFMYASFMSLALAAFMPSVGQTANSIKEAILGGVLGIVSLGVTIIIISLAFTCDIANVSQNLIPTLYIASTLNPVLAQFFTVIVMAGIYTSAAPMLWNFCARFAEDKSAKFNIIVVVIGIVSLIGGFVLPFDVLVNKVYSTYGYIGTVFMAFIVYKQITVKKEQKDGE